MKNGEYPRKLIKVWTPVNDNNAQTDMQNHLLIENNFHDQPHIVGGQDRSM